MSLTSKHAILFLAVVLSLPLVAVAQRTTTYANRQGDTVTDTRSLANGQYANDKTVTGPNGKTYTRDETASRNTNARLVTQTTRTGPNGKSATVKRHYGPHARTTTVTGPNGGSRTYRRPR